MLTIQDILTYRACRATVPAFTPSVPLCLPRCHLAPDAGSVTALNCAAASPFARGHVLGIPFSTPSSSGLQRGWTAWFASCFLSAAARCRFTRGCGVHFDRFSSPDAQPYSPAATLFCDGPDRQTDILWEKDFVWCCCLLPATIADLPSSL